ncbi:four helix bundle protein [Larkinella sp. VNQ87]|uniref:four helix bundle protein n=1 Tax=Larkinella sp. VNQ87 TaxID=3400921 RepID=UPI003C0DD2CB
MATIQQFEELEVWKLARELAKDVYACTSTGNFSKDFDLRNQIRRSSGSVMDNIAEGFERGSRGEFIQFLSIAKGSAGEVRSQLYRALDQLYIDQPTFDELATKARRASQMLNGLITRLKESDVKGWKYKKTEASDSKAP